MLIIFKMKNMFPFGKNIALEMDADQNYVPVLFKIHDMFHKGESMLWDFKLGGGANIYGSLVLNSIYSPLNWLVIFTKRGDVISFFNILLIIKLMIMSTTMYFFIKKHFKKLDEFWQITYSLAYVFSGWVYLMYSNIFFIDIAILFPAIMHFLIKLFKENKNFGLIITLSYSLILNFYLTYMIYLFIIISSIVYIIFQVEKKDRKRIILNLSYSLVFPLLIAAFAYFPTAVQTITSYRNSTAKGVGYFDYFFLKVVNITMSSIIVVPFVKLAKQTINNREKENLIYIIVLFLTTIGIIIEPINKIWHTGSYNSFPYRYSFIPIFILICGSLKYLSIEKQEKKYNEKQIFLIIVTCLTAIVIFFIKFGKIIANEMIAYNIDKIGIFFTMIIIFIFLEICYKYSFGIKKQYEKKIIISLLAILEIFIYSNWCINNYNYDSSNQALYYNKNLKTEDEMLYKYIDYQGGLGLNSSFIMRKPTLSNWLHIIPKKQIDFIQKFGYSKKATLIYGYGGTIFSDYVIGTKDIYSYLQLPEEIFKLNKKDNYKGKDVYLYEQKPIFGFKYDKLIDNTNAEGMFETQNLYYREMFSSEKGIIKIAKFDEKNTRQKEYNFKIKNNEPIVLYLETTNELLKSKIDNIEINNEKISIGNTEKIVYIDGYNSDINIDIIMSDDEDAVFKGIKFGYIKINDYKKMLQSKEIDYNNFEFYKNKLHINIDSEKEQYLFLPINNIDGWKGKNNGQNINIENEMYTFMSIKLNEGNNDIQLTFEPPYLKEGILLSMLGIVLLILYSIFREKINNIKILQDIIILLYYTISIVIFISVYIISNFIFI